MLSIKVPPLGESIVEATVGRWLKKEGQAVAAGDTIVELETDKITVEVPAPKGGVLVKRLRAEGDTVKVDDALAEVDESATAAATSAPTTPITPATPAVPAVQPERAVAPTQQSGSGSADAKTSPSVRRIAAEEGLDPATVAGSARDGRVTKADMLEAVAARGTGPNVADAGSTATQSATTASTGESIAATRGAPPENQNTPPAPADRHPSAAPVTTTPAGARETREKMSTRRKRIAEHLLEAQHATAHLTTFNEVDMSAVMALRDRLKDKVEKEHGVKLTYMPFFVRAACIALKAQPTVNAQVDGDSIVYRHYTHMGVAVASDQGLVVPVIKDADRKGMLDLSREVSAVAKRARDGKLTMDDLTGGTFTITNGGVFGSLLSTPILNYPQSGILGLHKIQERPVAVGGQVVIRPMMYVALSYDHRIVEGQHAVLFLVKLKELMEDPAAMLID